MSWQWSCTNWCGDRQLQSIVYPKRHDFFLPLLPKKLASDFIPDLSTLASAFCPWVSFDTAYVDKQDFKIKPNHTTSC